ncbi:hypothetical protein Snoj_28510 [Streptomyces nojiriensis]|uniref:HEXXH motif domain-containing protein n=1 Tax=Streptomyces nojiriensis TaxID=66374 RepID=A0ABQ3SLC5_9ACTN|nr:hypothetical protein [Streptomyces nojiriensis]QTI42530.1 hypothetical protein JYK04_00288 [Streptomyces nojiriensis]GGS39147.1 hypothetical protein GCM10010205_81090 [Streptomyces nojiriensis]GHI68933.1 hypothetical protein Snoj_28510 [Streptomyces nojiriensis]
MQTTIATRVESGSFFDLSREDPALTRLREDDAEPALPFALMERLVKSGIPYAEHARALSSDTVHVSGASFDWYGAGLPRQIAGEINQADYEIVEHTDGRRAALTQALERLASAHPEGFARVQEFVRGLLWVGLKPGTRTSSLTSSSDPALPYVIVFSEKARHHIPPNTVSEEPSHVFLAENLLHEAVHQSVSFHVLQHQVFADGYSSKTSPKIEIAWRATQGVARNQFWEVDRTFHATCVYNQLLRFRRSELDRDDLTTNERVSFQAAYDEGMPAVSYLMGQLELLDEHFTVHGRELLADLRHQTDQL